MYKQGWRGALALGALLIVAGCGKKAQDDAPIAFVPADTPYVIASLEPVSEKVTENWRRQMQQAWPVMTQIYGPIIDDIGKKDEAASRVLHALLDEVRGLDTPDKWRELGLTMQTRSAIYGIGLLPVLRLELADADAFRATVARVEQKSGAKLATARIGDQDLWTFGSAEVQGLMAIEGKHLVLGLVPGSADEALKRRVLGLDRPQKSLADTGALSDFNKARGYLPHGSGWVDTRRVLALYGNDPGLAAFAHAGGKDLPALDATCRSELDALATKAPRLALGYTALDGSRMTLHMRLDLEPTLAKTLAALPAALPAATAKDALLDFAFAMPVLRGRDFLVAQADAVAKAPFSCSLLQSLNDSFAEMKTKLDQVIPPPFADLVGARATIDHFQWPDGVDKPDIRGVLLIGSNNPTFLVNLAQISTPALAQLKLEPNAQPVAIPAGALPGAPADLEFNAALSAHAFGVSVGKDEAAGLGSAVAAAPGAPGTLLEMSMSGAMYKVLGDSLGRFSDKIPDQQRSQIEGSRQLYALYAQWIKRVDMRTSLTADGIDLVETVEVGTL
jgi:hypothetical protein